MNNLLENSNGFRKFICALMSITFEWPECKGRDKIFQVRESERESKKERELRINYNQEKRHRLVKKKDFIVLV